MAIKHLVSSADLSKADYEDILRRFTYFKERGISPDLARGKVVATLFFLPSTRTMNGFQSAIIRLGGGWIGTTSENGLSMEKGETFEETIREYSCFADLIALRHPDDDAAERAAAYSFVPVLNCGCGSREHAVGTPWVLTIIQHYTKKDPQGLKVGIYGTPEINRVSKAMLPVFGLFGMEVYVDDLGHFPFPKDIEEKAKANGLKKLVYGKLDDFIGEVDILFLTRGLQKGIIPPDKFPEEKEELILKSYRVLTTEDMKKLRKDAVLYMLKPRIFEVDPEVDKDPRAAYAQEEPYHEVVAAFITHFLDIKV